MQGPPFRAQSQTGLQIVGYQHAQQRPMLLAVLVRSQRIGLAQRGAVGHAHGGSIDEERALPHRRQGSAQTSG